MGLRLQLKGPRGIFKGCAAFKFPLMRPCGSVFNGALSEGGLLLEPSFPELPEMVTCATYRVCGCEAAAAMSAHAGQLELNVFEPALVYNVLISMDVLVNAWTSVSEHCVQGIRANEKRCRELVENSIGIVTGLLPHIGYKNCSAAAKLANLAGKSVKQVLLEEKMISEEELNKLLVPEKMVVASIAMPTSGTLI